MRISGLQKVTLLDYPGHIACTIFFGGCNLRCPFCHNMELVEHPEHFPEIKREEVIDFLKERKGKLNGVAITGGEPLLNTDIGELLHEIKALGYPIKLDTNGFFPDMIEKLIDEKLVDMFAMDIKAGFSNYSIVAGITTQPCESCTTERRGEHCEPGAISEKLQDSINKSISLLINKALDYEFRTTCVKGLHSEKDFYEIRDMIKGAKAYFLQDYKAAPGMESLPYKPFTREELESFSFIVKDAVVSVNIRGV
ncbi:MAG: anaerobic ribonucleoside-triphosphate reductase activating protein [Lachnospiraceae bacterium]|nr:anaerobic ribonucleoside-triphosphate reductase activating protein [Lachnospiraceae bacterium]